MAPRNKYIKTVQKQLGYFPTWLPGKEMSLGEIGFFKNGVFVHVTSLNELNIPFKTFIDTTRNDFNVGSTSAREKNLGVDISAPISYELIKDAGLKLTYDISKKNELVFITKGLAVNCIKDTLKIGQEIMKLSKANVWKNNWKVITEVIDTKSTLILFTKDDNAEIEVKPEVSIGTSSVELMDASLQWKIVNAKGLSVEIISNGKFTPLFMAQKIRKVKGELPQRALIDGMLPTSKESLVFEKIGIDDLDD